jgi:hypothetical protein
MYAPAKWSRLEVYCPGGCSEAAWFNQKFNSDAKLFDSVNTPATCRDKIRAYFPN